MSDDSKETKKKGRKAKKYSPDNGRPEIELTERDWRQIIDMCQIHCTGEEIASVLGISYDTLARRIKDASGLGFAEYYAQKSAGGKNSLRRTQWKLAQNGNATMLIWLGKQWLGQKDKQEISGDKDSPIVLAYPLPSKD